MAFDTQKQLQNVDASTFDLVKVQAFHNTRIGTILSYIWAQILLLVQFAILAADAYTCINILVFNRWSTGDYHVYEYKVAKWIFTGCILFRAVLMLYHLAWGIYTYKTRNIALAYLNNVAKMLYRLRRYDYHCLFHEIEHELWFDRAAFLVYEELDNALEVLVADTPRQVVNILTLRFYATNGDSNNDILANIRGIANTNVRLSVILSFQLASVAMFAFFFFRFCLGMLLYIPIRVSVSHRSYSLLKLYCYHVVNEKVRCLVTRNHKSRKQLLDEGVFDAHEILANPLLASDSSLDVSTTHEIPLRHPLFGHPDATRSQPSLYKPPPRAYTSRDVSLSGSTPENPFLLSLEEKNAVFARTPTNDTYDSLPQNPFGGPQNPFGEDKKRRRPPPENPFTDSTSSLVHGSRSKDIYMNNLALDSTPLFAQYPDVSANAGETLDHPLVDALDDTLHHLLDHPRDLPMEEVEDSPLLPQQRQFDDMEDVDLHQHLDHDTPSSVPYPLRGVSMFDTDFDQWSHK